MKNLLLSLFLMTAITGAAQHDYDVNQIHGTWIEKVILRFLPDTTFMLRDSLTLDSHRFGVGNLSMSDRYGTYLMSTNNCHIFGPDHRIMQGSEYMNTYADEVHRGFCYQNEFTSSPPVVHSMILPDLVDDSIYYFLYAKYRYALELGSSKMDSVFFQRIDMRANGGKGRLLPKTTLLLVDTSIIMDNFAATRNHDQTWTIMIPTIDNRYYQLEMDSTGFFMRDTIHTSYRPNQGELKAIDPGQGCFSPNGDYFAHYEDFDGLVLFRYDQERKQMRFLAIDSSYSIRDSFPNLWKGVAFSGNNRFLYVNALATDLYQYDLSNEDLTDRVLIHRFDEETDLLPNGFGLYLNKLQLEKDCKIYSAQAPGSPYYHIIHNPNGKGEECRFQLGFPAPAFTAGSTGLHPHWRTATEEEDWCYAHEDTSYTSSTDYYSPVGDYWMVYPNPTRGQLKVAYTRAAVKADQIKLYDMNGRLIKQWFPRTAEVFHADLWDVPKGIYLIQIWQEGKQEAVVKKVVVL